MADIDLDAIKARAEAATPGPWNADVAQRGDCVVWGPNGRFVLNAQAEPHWVEFPEGWPTKRSVAFDADRRDVEFIAHAREDVPALVAEVERLRGDVAESDDLWQTQARILDEVAVALKGPHPKMGLHDLSDLGEWARTATRHRAERDRAIQIIADLVAKGTPHGEDKDGFIAFYILPTGPIHRAIPYLDEHGIPARPGFDPRAIDGGGE